MQDKIFVEVDVRDINFFNRVMEGWEYVGVVSSLKEKGKLLVTTTPSMYDEAVSIIKNMPIAVKIIG
jgi:putative protease